PRESADLVAVLRGGSESRIGEGSRSSARRDRQRESSPGQRAMDLKAALVAGVVLPIDVDAVMGHRDVVGIGRCVGGLRRWWWGRRWRRHRRRTSRRGEGGIACLLAVPLERAHLVAVLRRRAQPDVAIAAYLRPGLGQQDERAVRSGGGAAHLKPGLVGGLVLP